MATYNGERYLSAMLDSIADQTHVNFRIIASDDGSVDGTCNILSQYAERLPIQLVRGSPGKGVLRNFEAALAATNAPYVTLCDQDDYWSRNKLAQLLRALRHHEQIVGSTTPLLVFSDLEIVDADLSRIRRSMYEGSIKRADAKDFGDYFFSSHVPGCAMAVNRALLDLALPFPDVEIHDWWLIQVAAIFGGIHYVDIPLVKYRQHSGNTIGLGNPSSSVWKGRLSKLRHPWAFLGSRWTRWEKQVGAIRKGLTALHTRFGDSLPPAVRELVDAGLVQPEFQKLNHLLRGAKVGEWPADYYAMLYLLTRRGRREA